MNEAELEKECQKRWKELGTWWDTAVEDGDYFHRTFIFPTIEKWVELRGGEEVLDAGCGNGALARRLVKMGARVLGVDFSSTLIEKARERGLGVEYEVLSLTDREQLKLLSQRKTFDRVVCSMVLHDMATILPFFETLPALLKPNGYFIFSIPHPCFNNSTVLFEPASCLTIQNDYISPSVKRLCSKPGQPVEQLVFQRPMREYFNQLISLGMVMDGFEEPCVEARILPENSVWGQRCNIPPALLSRWYFTL